MITKIAVGTAQLGMKYGIANVTGKPSKELATKILDFALVRGVRFFDTAPGYGNSEEILGEFISNNPNANAKNLNIITKLSRVSLEENAGVDGLYEWIKQQAIRSRATLHVKKIPMYLLHHAPDLEKYREDLIACLDRITKEGIIQKYGISVYTPDDVKSALNYEGFKVIQVPINIFDHRLIKTGLLQEIQECDYKIFARSVYLQGFIFLDEHAMPKNLLFARDFLLSLRQLCDEFHLDPKTLAFLFIRDMPEIDHVIVGIEKIDQLIETIHISSLPPLTNSLKDRILQEFQNVPEKLVNPSLWNQ